MKDFSPSAKAAPFLFLPVRLAWRELRGGLRGFYIFVACIALGVAAIAGVGSLTRSLTDSIANQGQVLLGGDVSLSRVHQRATSKDLQEMQAFGNVSEIGTMRSMARLPDASAQALIELKAVDTAYPLYGTVALQNQQWQKSLLEDRGALVDPLLIEQLGLAIGSQVRVGEGLVTIRGVLTREPDRLSSRNVFGPRMLMSLKTLQDTGLLQPASLIRWRYRIKTQEPVSDIEGVSTTIEQTFRPEGFLLRNRNDPAPGIQNAVSRVGKFLVLVGLTALLIGGVGVANAVNTYVEQKRNTIATLKCLGAQNSLIFQIYFAQVLMIALVGIAIGLLIGGVLPAMLAPLYMHLLPFDLILTPQSVELLAASFYGLLVALLFMLWPLNRTRHISPQMLFRETISQSKNRFRFWDIATLILLAGLLGFFAISTAALPWIAFYFCAGLCLLFLVFVVYGYGLKKAFRALPPFRTISFMLVRANLAGPNSLIRTIVLSLGLGLSLLVTLALVDSSLRAQLEAGLPKKAPDYFFLDIKQDQISEFATKVKAAAPAATLTQAPMLRGRIVSLKGVATENISAPNEVAWILKGDRGITYSDIQPADSELVDGTWWDKNHSGPPLVSFEAESGMALGLEVGDTITVNILGREISAQIANFRTVKWESLSINFVMIFSSNTLAGAPFNMLATLQLPDDAQIAQEGMFIQTLSRSFPNITTIRVRDAIQAVSGLYEQIIVGIRMAGSIMLVAGALVLVGALATAHRRRIYEAAIFKTLGATRGRILSAHLLEYASLAAATAFIALLMGSVAAWAVVTFVLDLPFSFSLATSLQTVMFTCLLVLALGAIGSWRTLSAKTVTALRQR